VDADARRFRRQRSELGHSTRAAGIGGRLRVRAIAFATLPTALATEAAGVYSLIRSIGSSIGISIVSVAMTRGAQASFGVLRGYVDPYRPEVRQYLDPLHLKAQGAGLALLARETARCRRKCSAC
jgi:hypothetical protein